LGEGLSGENRAVCGFGRLAAWVWEDNMSIFKESQADRGSTRRVLLRHLLPLALFAVAVVFLAPAGSAKPGGGTFGICVQNAATLAPTCGSTGHSSFAGNTAGVRVQVTITNASTSSGSLTSATLDLPDQLRVDTAAGAPAPAGKVVANGAGEIKVTGVNVQPGHTYVVTFFADTACAGTGTWPSPTGSAGFTYDGGLSTGTTSDLSTGCHLAFVTHPAATATGQPITDQAGSTGSPVSIGLFDDNNANAAMTSCPVGYSGCSVTVAQTPGNGAQGGNWTAVPFQTVSGNFRASFNGSLSLDLGQMPASFTLSATGNAGFAITSAASNSFDIAQFATSCSGNGCNLSQKLLKGFDNNVDSLASLTTANVPNLFTFATLSTFQFPATGETPAGCANFSSLKVAGLAETDGRTPGGTMTISYFVNMKLVQAKYGKNVGQQLIPICAGAKPVDANGVAHNCSPAQPGWVDKTLDATGAFQAGTSLAVCDADPASPWFGYYWGILSSFQDKTDATQNPVVTNWGSGTIGNTNYRRFDITVPGNWDWRAGS
jgi:hypothetical protein